MELRGQIVAIIDVMLYWHYSLFQNRGRPSDSIKRPEDGQDDEVHSPQHPTVNERDRVQEIHNKQQTYQKRTKKEEPEHPEEQLQDRYTPK
jgi:hypothetical protein